jgi:hypothetical protein
MLVRVTGLKPVASCLARVYPYQGWAKSRVSNVGYLDCDNF